MFYDDSIRVILRHIFYEYHYSPHKLAFQNIMRAGDQKLMIDLEWPYIYILRIPKFLSKYACFVHPTDLYSNSAIEPIPNGIYTIVDYLISKIYYISKLTKKLVYPILSIK